MDNWSCARGGDPEHAEEASIVQLIRRNPSRKSVSNLFPLYYER